MLNLDNFIAWKQQNIGTIINAMNILFHKFSLYVYIYLGHA